MKESFEYFAENIWPEMAEERGLPEDAEPDYEAFIDWATGQADDAMDRAKDRDVP